MKHANSFLRVAIDGLLLLGLVLVLVVVIRPYTQVKSTPAPQAQMGGEASVIQETTLLPSETIVIEMPYPPPVSETPELIPTPTPTPQAPLPAEQLSRLMGKTATLREGNIWLLEPDRDPKALTDFGDVAVIFGWNKDGSLMLFGRGRVEQPEFSSDTTDLWILDVNTRQARQFTASGMVNSAAWSPKDDEIAYTENNDVLTVADLKGTKLHQLERIILGFNWSPDGSALAVITYTPDMIASDGLKYTVLAVWQLPDEQLQVLGDAKRENHSFPIWSLDGQRILFRRDFYEADQQYMSGLYIVEMASGQMKYIEDTIGAMNPVRSPRADLVAYRVGDNIYVTDFDGQSKIVAQGRSFTWLSDGRTLFYRAMDNSIQMVGIDIQVEDSVTGGQRYSVDLYIQPEYFIHMGITCLFPLPGVLGSLHTIAPLTRRMITRFPAILMFLQRRLVM